MLVTNYGEGEGLQNGRGGMLSFTAKFYRYEKAGRGGVLAMMKGGSTSFGEFFFYMVA